MVKVKKPLFSFLLSTNNKRDIFRTIIKNIREVFKNYPHEICVASLNSNGDYLKDLVDKYVNINKPEPYNAYKEAYAMSTGKYVQITADDILFSKNYPEVMLRNFKSGYRIMKCAFVEPQRFVIINKHQVNYGVSIMTSALFKKYQKHLIPDNPIRRPLSGSVVRYDEYMEEYAKVSGEKYKFETECFVLHMGMPYGVKSTISVYFKNNMNAYNQWVIAKRNGCGNVRLPKELFPFYEDFKVSEIVVTEVKKVPPVNREILPGKLKVHKLFVQTFNPTPNILK